jgi:hypothetical protein
MELGGRQSVPAQPPPRTQRAKSSVLALLPHRVVPTPPAGRNADGSTIVRTCLHPGTPAIEQYAAREGTPLPGRVRGKTGVTHKGSDAGASEGQEADPVLVTAEAQTPHPDSSHGSALTGASGLDSHAVCLRSVQRMPSTVKFPRRWRHCTHGGGPHCRGQTGGVRAALRL